MLPFTQIEVDCYVNAVCGLMFEYGPRWIYHLEDIHAPGDLERYVRTVYGLDNDAIDTEAFLQDHGW